MISELDKLVGPAPPGILGQDETESGTVTRVYGDETVSAGSGSEW